MTVELGTILGPSAFVFLSVVGLAWCVGRVEERLIGVERLVERVQADVGRLREDIAGLREDVEVILLRLPAKTEETAGFGGPSQERSGQAPEVSGYRWTDEDCSPCY